jgi:hypothetical protein
LPPPAWPYWQAPALDLRPTQREAPREALPPTWLKSDATWRGYATAIVDKVRSDGVALQRTRNAEVSIGAFYEERARRGAPLLVTADALFAIVHLAFASAAADVDNRVMAGELSTVLHRLDARLGAEVAHARPDLLEGYRVARTAVAVALVLADAAYVVPADLVPGVASEVALVRTHAGVQRSPLFEVPLDYGSMLPRGPISSPTDLRSGSFQAAEWLASAPFLFAGEGEGAEVNVGVARAQARAALLLARLLVKSGDGAAAAASTRMGRIDRFTLGGADDLSPANAADLAGKSGIDLLGGSDIASTVKLDHFRRAAGLRSMRLVPLRAPADGRALQALTYPFVGALPAADAGAPGLPAMRKTPSALDVAAWLGSPAAKAALTARGDGGYARFEPTLARLAAERSADERSLHASVYASLLEAMATWLRPSSADATRPVPPGDAEGRRSLQTALAAWTLLRHDALPFAHDGARILPPRAATVSAHAARVFIEPHPEAIASLLGALRQLHRGLHELGALGDDAPSIAVLTEAESLLSLALDAAARTANGDPTVAELEPALAEIPGRIVALEAVTRPAAEPQVIDVHVDVGSGRILEEGTGPLEELFLWADDPVAHRSLLVVGAAIPHVELVESGGARLGDAAWRALIAAGGLPARDALYEPETVPSE